MLHKKFTKNGLTALAMASAIVFAPSANAALTYSNDFESFTTGAIPGFVIGNIVNGGAGWFPGPSEPNAVAPGDYNNGYSQIVNEGGAEQGTQQMSVFSDYNGWSPFAGGAGTTIQAFVYTDVGLIDASDVGKTMTFTFDTKLPGTNAVTDDPASQAEAFFKVLDAVGGTYDEWLNLTFDSDANATTDWSTQSLSFVVDATLVGQLVQIGFNNTATDWAPSSVIYDNLNVEGVSAVPVPAAVWLFGSGLLGLVGVARRRKA